MAEKNHLAPADLPSTAGMARNSTRPPSAKPVHEDSTADQPPESAHSAQQLSSAEFEIPIPEARGYRLCEPLNAGTYGIVWRAQDEKTGKVVAIKFLQHATDQQLRMLENEVRQLIAVQDDPGIVQLLDVNSQARPPYYVMALYRGSLADRIKKGPLSVAEALVIFRRVTVALAYLHVRGIRHCDLKPGNVLLDTRGQAFLADFGQAHLSSEVIPVLGTFFYMAPEQASLEEHFPDARWDVYGLGALLYAMLTQNPPREELRPTLDKLKSTQRLDAYRTRLGKQPKPEQHRSVKGMDRDLAAIVDRCLELDPERRYHDAGAVLEALDRRERRLHQRPTLRYGAAVTVFLVLVLVVVTGLLCREGIRQIGTVVTDRADDHDEHVAKRVAEGIQPMLASEIRLVEAGALFNGFRLALDQNSTVYSEQHAKVQGYLTNWCDAQRVRQFMWLTNNQGRVEAVWPIARSPQIESLGSAAASVLGPTVERVDHQDWFNGTGDQARRSEIYPPVKGWHISKAFFSRDLGIPIVAVSAPIFDPTDDNPQIVGVIATAVPLSKLRDRLAAYESPESFAALIDAEGHYLVHLKENPARIAPGPSEPRSLLSLGNADLAALHRDGRLDALNDPVDQNVYRTKYAPISSVQDRPFGWGILVQRKHETITNEISGHAENFLRFVWWAGVWVVGVIGVAIPLLWFCLLRRNMRGGEQVSHG